MFYTNLSCIWSDLDLTKVKFSEYTKKPVIFPYTLHKTTLKTTENAKYLRITINSLRFIRRNVKTQNKQLKKAAYTT